MDKLDKFVDSSHSMSLRQSYMDACSDPDFVKYVNNLKIKEELLIKYTSSLMDCVKERKMCKNCSSFSDCCHDVKGYVLTPERVDQRVLFTYVACSKYQKYLESTKNITYFDVAREIKRASFQNLYKDDKARVPIIKYFKEFMDSYKNDKKGKGIFLTGSFGSGKTYLIAALFNELSKKNIKSTIVYYPEFLRTLKSSFQDDYREKFDCVKKSPILLIDDIGAENCSSWSRDEVLSPILQYRMEEELPTFFTSNFNMRELEEHLSNTFTGTEKVKARRIIERIRQLTVEITLVTKSRRD